MTRTDFIIMSHEVLNEIDCRIDSILFTDDNIAIVNYWEWNIVMTEYAK